jgi:hypothetical protein
MHKQKSRAPVAAGDATRYALPIERRHSRSKIPNRKAKSLADLSLVALQLMETADGFTREERKQVREERFRRTRREGWQEREEREQAENDARADLQREVSAERLLLRDYTDAALAEAKNSTNTATAIAARKEIYQRRILTRRVKRFHDLSDDALLQFDLQKLNAAEQEQFKSALRSRIIQTRKTMQALKDRLRREGEIK